MAFTLDWSGTNIDGSNALTDGGDSVTAVVSTPSGDGSFTVGTVGGMPSGTLISDLVQDGGNDTPSVTVDFTDGGGSDVEVENISFVIYDIDEKTSGRGYQWDDLVGIKATDALGNFMPVTITASGGQEFTLVPDANGFYYIDGEQNNSDITGDVTISIAGPVSELTINFTDADERTEAGYIGVGDLTFDLYEPPCFVRGTFIETETGATAVEDLSVGDLVRTADNGLQPVRWVGSSKVAASGRLAPIEFKKGSIGNSEDLLVSPWHRVLVQNWQAEMLFGSNEVLVAAKALLNDHSITRKPQSSVEYFHILFDHHEIVFSNGAPTESFHPRVAGKGAMLENTRTEILQIFPELESALEEFGEPARPTLNANEAALLIG